MNKLKFTDIIALLSVDDQLRIIELAASFPEIMEYMEENFNEKQTALGHRDLLKKITDKELLLIDEAMQSALKEQLDNTP